MNTQPQTINLIGKYSPELEMELGNKEKEHEKMFLETLATLQSAKLRALYCYRKFQYPTLREQIGRIVAALFFEAVPTSLWQSSFNREMALIASCQSSLMDLSKALGIRNGFFVFKTKEDYEEEFESIISSVKSNH